MDNFKSAVITNCPRIVLRDRPSLNAEPVLSLTCLTDVRVDLDRSNESFFCVITESGEEGYCLKRYIALCSGR